jgi:hypothetical protein
VKTVIFDLKSTAISLPPITDILLVLDLQASVRRSFQYALGFVVFVLIILAIYVRSVPAATKTTRPARTPKFSNHD